MILFDDPRFDAHDQGPGHPESPARLQAVREALSALPGPRLPGRLATRAELLTVHRPTLVDAVLATRGRRVQLDPDVITSPGSVQAALLAVGASLDAATQLVQGTPSFVLARPPGHHATPHRSMGFCLFNQAAIAARALSRGSRGPRRVLLLDLDVHHGNGSQDIFVQDPDVLYLSMHGFGGGFYPGTGAASEQGEGAGRGFTVNIPMAPGSGDTEYRSAFQGRAWPAIEAFAPEYCVLSAGFDALWGDPLGGMRLTVEGMASLWAPVLRAVPTMAVLEGGYHLQRTAEGVAATAELLHAQGPSRPPHALSSPPTEAP